MRAYIEWVRPDEGGRDRPPSGEGSLPYTTVVRFDGESDTWPPADSWSLVVEKVEAPGPYSWTADISYLVDEAPKELLTSGRRFELYEGERLVAVGTLK